MKTKNQNRKNAYRCSILALGLGIVSGLASGCANTRKEKDFERHSPSPEGMIYSSAVAEVQQVRMRDVRNPGTVRAYVLTRRHTDASGTLLREPHVVYRIEESPSWVLDPSDSPRISLGMPTGAADPNLAPAMLQSELAYELARQRAINEALMRELRGKAVSSALWAERAQALDVLYEENAEALRAMRQFLDESDGGRE